MKEKETNKELMKEEMGNAQQASEMLNDDDLDDVVGGAFANIPRVPVKKIDQKLRDRV